MGTPMNFGNSLPDPPASTYTPVPLPPCDSRPVEHPRPVHFYHLHAGASAWLQPATEHFRALQEAEFWGEVYVGLVGPPERRKEASLWLDRTWHGWDCITEEDAGYEQVTLEMLQAHAQYTPLNTPVLYAHTKWAWPRGSNQDLWRRCMQKHCVSNWRGCAALLDEGYDTVGVQWITPYMTLSGTGGHHYGGNYWWATAGYLAGLPPVTHGSRFDAEGWIGLDGPKNADLAPGWIDHENGVSCSR